MIKVKQGEELVLYALGVLVKYLRNPDTVSPELILDLEKALMYIDISITEPEVMRRK